MTNKLERSPNRIARIRALNDQFRQSGRGGDYLITEGVATLSVEEQICALTKVRFKTDFDQASDPHHEHDFGSVKVGEQTIFFKIDYYDKDRIYGSTDPADPALTTRVMTIMLACEY